MVQQTYSLNRLLRESENGQEASLQVAIQEFESLRFRH